MASRSTLVLYREMLRESSKFTSYIYRTYAIRRIKDAFRSNRSVEDPAQKEVLLQHARQNLEIIKRQAVLSEMFKDQRLVIEQKLTEPGAKMSSNLSDV